jgi:hypothetical protein
MPFKIKGEIFQWPQLKNNSASRRLMSMWNNWTFRRQIPPLFFNYFLLRITGNKAFFLLLVKKN